MILTLTRSSLTSFILKWTATRVVLWRKVFLEILQNSQGSTCDSLCFLNKVTGWGTFTKEETLAKVFSGEISKSTILIEHLWAVASVKHKYQWQLWNSPSSHMMIRYHLYNNNDSPCVSFVLDWEIILFIKRFKLRQCYWRLAMLILWDYQRAITFENKKTHQDHLSSSSSLFLFQSFLISNFRQTEI